MQWVETTGKTIEEAKDLALDRLGVAEDDAEVEVLEEPRSGLFGRTRGQARVKARIRPKGPRPKQERRRRGGRSGSGDAGSAGGEARQQSGSQSSRRGKDEGARSGDRGGRGGSGGAGAERDGRDGETGTGGAAEPGGGKSGGPVKPGGPVKKERTKQERPRPKERVTMEDEAQVRTVTEFLAGLADAMGVEATAQGSVEEGTVHATLEGDDLGILVGPRLATLDAIQEIARNALQREAGDRDHGKVVLDVGGVRELRRGALVDFVNDVAERVRSERVEVALEVMSSVDRKVVHDTVSELDGVESVSEGEDPRRRVVIRPA